jgi:hypothetical protein
MQIAQRRSVKPTCAAKRVAKARVARALLRFASYIAHLAVAALHAQSWMRCSVAAAALWMS